MNTKMRTWVAQGVLCALMGVLPACGPDATVSSIEPTSGPDEVDIVQQAVLESTCWTQTWPDRFINVSSTPQQYNVDSADASYGHSTCPHQFVLDMDSIGGHSFQVVIAEPTAQFGASSDWCPGFWGITKVKGWTGNQWLDVDYWQEAGFYTGGLLTFPHCASYITAGRSPRLHAKTHGFTAIRIVTQGGFANATYQPVSVSVQVDL